MNARLFIGECGIDMVYTILQPCSKLHGDECSFNLRVILINNRLQSAKKYNVKCKKKNFNKKTSNQI